MFIKFQKSHRLFWTTAIVGMIVAAANTGVSAAPAPDTSEKTAVVAVKGLSCPLCARRLQKVLSALPGAHGAKVELAKEKAVIDFAADTKTTDEQIAKTVRDAGFIPGKIEWNKPTDRAQ